MTFTKLLSAAALLAAPFVAHAGLVDGSFEIKGAALPVTNYCYDGFATAGGPACAAGAWVGNGVIASGSGAWGGTVAADGGYYGFVQGAGPLAQTFTADSSGSQSLTWFDANRTNNGGLQSYTVTISDGVTTQTLGTYTSAFGGFVARSASPFTLVGGSTYTLSFNGLVSADVTSFIDGVALSVVPEPATWSLLLAGFGLSGVALRRRRTVVSA